MLSEIPAFQDHHGASDLSGEPYLRKRTVLATNGDDNVSEHTTARFLAWPAPVATEYVRYPFCLRRSSSGRMPMAVPPASVAPRAAASITPESPPQTTGSSFSATSLPTSRAFSRPPAAVPEPTTAT